MTIPESHLAQEAIAALVDGELTAGPAGRAAKHLAGCGQCRLAVQAQREAKEALNRSRDVAVPGDLLTRLQAIPFTTDVSSGSGFGGSGLGGLAAGPDELTLHGASGGWSVPLHHDPQRRADQARWLRRGVAGSVAVGLGLAALAISLSVNEPADGGSSPSVARPSLPEQHTGVVPPVVRTLTVRSTLSGSGGTP
jgi:anti-sigma factor RsiW